MVGNLEQVDAREPGGEQLGIDTLLDVTHQEEPPGPDLAGDHDRDVVDRRAAVGRFDRDAPADGPEHAHRDLVDAEAIAGGNAGPDRTAAVRELRQPGGIPGSRPAHPGLEHAVHLVPREEERQSSDMILVRMRQDHGVDAPIPGRDAAVERDDQTIRIRSAVDEEAATTRALDEDRIALPHVEDRHPRGAARTGQGHATGDAGRDDQGHRQQPMRADQAVVLRAAVRRDRRCGRRPAGGSGGHGSDSRGRHSGAACDGRPARRSAEPPGHAGDAGH